MASNARLSMPSRSRKASKRCQGAERWTRIRSKECLEQRRHPAQQGFPAATRLTVWCRVPLGPDMRAIRSSHLLSACLLLSFPGNVDSETLIAATIKPLKLMESIAHLPKRAYGVQACGDRPQEIPRIVAQVPIPMSDEVALTPASPTCGRCPLDEAAKWEIDNVSGFFHKHLCAP
jgi:hypothetical protein